MQSSGAPLGARVPEDAAALRLIFAGLDRLELAATQASENLGAFQRGYFSPDEDDRVRQLLLAYRNHRLALYDIIARYVDCDYDAMNTAPEQLRGFIVGLAAALRLYAASLRLIRAYERVPLMRRKLNEPDAKFDLEAGFFDRIRAAYSSLANYWRLQRALFFWRRNRRLASELAKSGDEEIGWLCDEIQKARRMVRFTFWMILWQRLWFDWYTLRKSLQWPLRKIGYRAWSFVAGSLAEMRITPNYRPGIDAALAASLREKLKPGDILLVRPERKLTTTILPGFWTHTALYLGTLNDLRTLGLADQSRVQAFRTQIAAAGDLGAVVEAISPRVDVRPLQRLLYADHVAVLRPKLTADELRAALLEALAHVGKAYDFEFDFNTTTRIVCSELVFRGYHNRGGIAFRLTKRLGRYTLTCDDIVEQYLEALQNGSAPFELVALALQGADGRTRFIPDADAIDILRNLQDGSRP